MKKVYLIRPNSEYGAAGAKNQALGFYEIEGKIIENWQLVDWEYYYTKFKQGDIFSADGAIGLRQRAFEILKNILLKYVQLLPIKLQGEVLQVINVTKYLDCFDFNNSFYRNIDVRMIYTISGKEALIKYKNHGEINRVLFEHDACLISSKITAPLFYTMDRIHFMGPYVTSGFFPEDEELFHIVQKEKIMGLEFIEIKLS